MSCDHGRSIAVVSDLEEDTATGHIPSRRAAVDGVLDI